MTRRSKRCLRLTSGFPTTAIRKLLTLKAGRTSIGPLTATQNFQSKNFSTRIVRAQRINTPAAQIESRTIPKLFLQTYLEKKKKIALQVERDGKWVYWTWADYLRDVMNFAKALHVMGVTERSSVNIIGWNSP